MIDAGTRAAAIAALKGGTITRAMRCWENAPCRTRTVRPIRLDDEAAYAVDTVLRALARAGYRIEREERRSERRIGSDPPLP